MPGTYQRQYCMNIILENYVLTVHLYMGYFISILLITGGLITVMCPAKSLIYTVLFNVKSIMIQILHITTNSNLYYTVLHSTTMHTILSLIIIKGLFPPCAGIGNSSGIWITPRTTIYDTNVHCCMYSTKW